VTEAPQTDTFDPAYFEGLADVEGDSFWFRGRNRLILWALGRYFPEARSLLEVGCGTGAVLQAIHTARPEIRLVGGELHREGLEIASRRVPDATLRQLDAVDLPFDGEFDVVCAFDVIEHVDDDRRVLAQLHRATRPGGGLVVTVPQHMWLWSAADELGRHKRRYSRRELEAKIANAGFTRLQTTSFVSLLLPAMALSRLRMRRPAEDVDVLDEFRLPRPVDRAFGALLDLERLAIGRGVSFPVGGSLIAVYKKP